VLTVSGVVASLRLVVCFGIEVVNESLYVHRALL